MPVLTCFHFGNQRWLLDTVVLVVGIVTRYVVMAARSEGGGRMVTSSRRARVGLMRAAAEQGVAQNGKREQAVERAVHG